MIEKDGLRYSTNELIIETRSSGEREERKHENNWTDRQTDL